MSGELFFPKYVDPLMRDDFVRTCYVFDNYDGDTIYYHADLGYDVWATFLTGRLLDVQAPEIRPLVSREEGKRSKFALWDMITEHALNRHLMAKPFGHQLRLKSVPADNKWLPDAKVMRRGKYGRWLVVLLGVDDAGRLVNLNELMVANGFAKPYEA